MRALPALLRLRRRFHGNCRMRATWFRSGLYLPAIAIEHRKHGVAVSDLALAADLLEPMPSSYKIIKHSAREAILDLWTAAARIGRISADEEARRFDGMLRVHPSIDHVQDDVVDGCWY